MDGKKKNYTFLVFLSVLVVVCPRSCTLLLYNVIECNNSISWEWNRRGFRRVYRADRSIGEAASRLLVARQSKRGDHGHNLLLLV